MDADDFQDLYKLLRGSRSATAVLDAHALYLERKLAESLAKLVHARDSFLESRSRLLKQDVAKQVDAKAKDAELQIKKLKRKQDKLIETVKSFDELVPALEKLVERDLARQAKTETASAEPIDAQKETEQEVEPEPNEWQPVRNSIVARADDVSRAFVEQFQSAQGEELLDVISDKFDFREVQTEQDILGDALYYVQTSKRNLLALTPATDELANTITLTSAIDGKTIKPLSRKAFLKLGIGRKMVLLTKREHPLEDTVQFDTNRMETAGAEIPSGPDADNDEPSILDMGAFSQLLSAAQRSGLVSAANQIGHVRDREFRMGKYDHAFEAINSIFTRFSANANQRTQQLGREDAEIAAGRIKISPKDLQAKRIRDRTQTQEIDRANRRFQVVLEGLRILMNRSEEDSEHDPDSDSLS